MSDQKKPGAILTKARLIAIKRLMAHEDWPVLQSLLEANFPIDESMFVKDKEGRFDPLAAAIRDGQTTVLLFIRGIKQTPTPSDDEE